MTIIISIKRASNGKILRTRVNGETGMRQPLYDETASDHCISGFYSLNCTIIEKSIREVEAQSMNIEFHHQSEIEKEALLGDLATHLQGFEEIAFAYAYGSFVEEGPFRDLDAALYLYPEDLPQSTFSFEDKVSQEFIRNLHLNFPIDIRVMNGASVAFQYHVIQGRLLMERSEDHRIRIVANIIARYLDIKPVLDHHTKEAFAIEAKS